MTLICVSRFRGEDGNGNLHDYIVGEQINDTEEVISYLLRKSPESFEVPQEKPDPLATEPADVAAMSTVTETNVKAADRRQRGGRKRKTN